MKAKAAAFLLLLGTVPLLPQTAAFVPSNVQAWDLLNKELSDPNPDKRKQAVAAMGAIGLAPESIHLIEKSLSDKDPVVRQTAVAVLGQIRSNSSIPVLKTALDDPDDAVAFTAAKALWDLGDRSGRSVLDAVLTGERKDAPGMVQGAMRDAKSKMRSPRGIAMMGLREASGALLGPFSIGVIAAQEMMKDGAATGRVLSLTLMSQECDARVNQLLEWSLVTDRNWVVKAAAARALGSCGSPDSVPKLEPFLLDGHEALKLMAAASIVRLSITNPTPTVQEKAEAVAR